MRVLETSRVSPTKLAGSTDSLTLNFFDFLFTGEPPVRRVFFYRFPHPTAHFVETVLPALKTSLSTTLDDFYPLAGRIRSSLESSDKLCIRYEDGDSVPFTLAEYCDTNLEYVSGSQNLPRSKLEALISHLPSYNDDDMPLLAVQITLFPNSGFAIAVGISHVACDGSGFMHFVRSWADTCRASGSTEPLPSFDRSTIIFPESLAKVSLADVKRFCGSNAPQGPPVDVTSQDDDVVLATFNMGKACIEKLKRRISGTSVGACSGFMVTCAYAWVSFLKARGYDPGKRVVLNFSADCRGRLNPPVSPAYFGNCVRPCFVDGVVGDLIAEDGLVIACERLKEAIKQLEGGLLEGWEQLAMISTDEQPMSVIGSPKFAAYDADFGWGKPVKVDFPALRAGSISMTDNREEHGGIQLGVALRESEMTKFRSNFSVSFELVNDL